MREVIFAVGIDIVVISFALVSAVKNCRLHSDIVIVLRIDRLIEFHTRQTLFKYVALCCLFHLFVPFHIRLRDRGKLLWLLFDINLLVNLLHRDFLVSEAFKMLPSLFYLVLVKLVTNEASR